MQPKKSLTQNEDLIMDSFPRIMWLSGSWAGISPGWVDRQAYPDIPIDKFDHSRVFLP